jgi:hypothetical protein
MKARATQASLRRSGIRLTIGPQMRVLQQWPRLSASYEANRMIVSSGNFVFDCANDCREYSAAGATSDDL